MSDDFLSAPLADIKPLIEAASRGDAEAKRYFATVFPPTARCILCDSEVGTEGSVFTHPDPGAPQMALLMPVCRICLALPAGERRTAELRIARALWPHLRWKPNRGNDPAYLRAGGPLKPRRAHP